MAFEVPRGLRLTTQVLVGLVIVGFGLLLTARNVGWLSAYQVRDVMQYWPLLIVAMGLLRFVQAGTNSSRLFAGMFILVGVWLSAEQFYDLSFRFWDWWPLLLVGVGGILITRAWGGPAGPVGVTTSERAVSEFAFWSGVQRRIGSANFSSASLTAVMGGIELDLRNAGTGGADAVIDVFVMWGGIELKLPPDWVVSNQALTIMGGFDDRSTGTQQARGRVIVRGVILMGGIEIKT